MGSLKYLIDTCTFIWLCAEPERLSADAVLAMEKDPIDLFLSDVSVMEICLKWKTGKLVLPSPPRSWVEAQLSVWSITSSPLDKQDLYRVTELLDTHKDPFDRLLVASALRLSAAIITPDKHIHAYPVECIW